MLGLRASNTENPDDWIMSNMDGRAAFYRPRNFDNAMAAFVRLKVSNSPSECSGVRIRERQPNGLFSVYIVTAAHCLYDVSPLGIVKHYGYREKNSGARAYSFLVTQFGPKVLDKQKVDDRFASLDKSNRAKIGTRPLSYVERKYILPKSHVYSGIISEQLENLDVVRFKINRDVRGELVQFDTLPICKQTLKPEAVTPKKSPIRLLMGLTKSSDGKQSEVHLARMSGVQNQGISQEQFGTAQGIVDFIKNTQEFRGSQLLYSYRTEGGMGVEGSDSGAPVLYGELHDPSVADFRGAALSEQQINNWKASVHGKPNQWKVEKIDCVSGIAIREFWEKKFDIINPVSNKVDVGVDLKVSDPSRLVESSTSIIQEISEDGWRIR
jgi:hypothetical protein